MARDHYGEAPHIWIERFSQLTTNAIKRGDTGIAAKHLNRVAAMLDSGDEATLRCIDVAYVESLMWDIKDDGSKREGWKLMPASIRTLYLKMWGKKPFMRGVK